MDLLEFKMLMIFQVKLEHVFVDQGRDSWTIDHLCKITQLKVNRNISCIISDHGIKFENSQIEGFFC